MNERRAAAVVGLVVLVVLTIGIPLTTRPSLANETAPVPRPESWAQRMELQGVPNLCKVSDDLYRSAQPCTEGMVNLDEMGIRTAVNLRLLNSDREEIEGTSMAYVHIRMEAWDADEGEVLRFLEVVSDPDRVPVLVHCSLGFDRTGTMCAAYRVAVQGWGKDEAIAEMTQGGFGFNEVWANLPLWIWMADVVEMKAQADTGPSLPEESPGDGLLALAGMAGRALPWLSQAPVTDPVLPGNADCRSGLPLAVV